MFNAIGFNGVSEPDDKDDVDDGETRDVVNPMGIELIRSLEDAAALTLVKIELIDDGIEVATLVVIALCAARV